MMPHTIYALTLAGALCSAGATICIRLGLRDGDAYTGFWINLFIGTLGLWGAVFWFAPGEVADVKAIPFFVLAGLLGTFAGRLLRFLSIAKVGASVSAAINNLNPFISTALAILFLGEHITTAILAGTSVIVCGTILLSASRKQVGFSPWQLIYPFLSAVCFGVVAIIRKMGLSHTGPIFGFAVNVTTAFIAFTIFLLAIGHQKSVVCTRRSLWYFVAAGVAENAGVFMVLVALGLGTVSVVVPLFGTAPLFVLPMAFIFLKGVETLSGRLVAGVIMIVLGVYLLTSQ